MVTSGIGNRKIKNLPLLSQRAKNCLVGAEIETLRDLDEWTEEHLLRIRNFGLVCMRELKKTMADLGLTLKTNPILKLDPQFDLNKKLTEVEHLLMALDKLTSREREVIKLRYGLAIIKQRSVTRRVKYSRRETAEILGMTSHRVCQMEKRALRRLNGFLCYFAEENKPPAKPSNAFPFLAETLTQVWPSPKFMQMIPNPTNYEQK